MESIKDDKIVKKFTKIIKHLSKVVDFLDSKNPRNDYIEWENNVTMLQENVIDRFVEKIKNKYNLDEDEIIDYADKIIESSHKKLSK